MFYADYRKGFKLTAVSIALTWMASTVMSLLVALFLDTLNRPMSWYSKTWLLFMLYSIPVIVINLLSIQIVKHFISRMDVSTLLLIYLYNDCHLAYSSAILALLTYLQLASSFVITTLSLFFFFQSFIYSCFSPSKLSTHFTSPKLIFHFLFSLIPIFLITFLIEGVLMTFVPIMGRSGVTAISDFIMAFMVAFATNLLLSLNVCCYIIIFIIIIIIIII